MTCNYNEYTHALNYKDVYLVPNYSELSSRTQADTSLRIKDFRFTLPIMPSNMRTVVDIKTYHLYADLGVAPIMHRFDMANVDILRRIAHPWRAISVGVKEEDRKGLEDCKYILQTPACVCIEIGRAHV